MNKDELIDFKIKYRMLFDRLTSGHPILFSTDDGFVFMDESGHEVKISFNDKDREMLVKTKINDKDYTEIISLPEANSKYLRTRELISEKRPNGCKEDEIIRFYCKVNGGDTYYTTDLFQTTKCSNDLDTFKSTFECHMHNNTTIFNNRDITYLYKNVEDDLKVEKIYNLYNGIYEKIILGELYDISIGRLDPKCFDYKAYNGIKDKEDELIGRNERIY